MSSVSKLTYQEIRRLCTEAGLAAVSVPDGYDAEQVSPGSDATIYVRDCRRPDGSESGTGETFNPYDSPEYKTAYRAEYKRIKSANPEDVALAESQEQADIAERKRLLGGRK